MRPEQITELGALEEQLIDLFKAECTPAKWRNAVSLNDKEIAMREKKVALATMQIVGRVQNSLRDVRVGGGEQADTKPPADAGDGDEKNADIARVERNAKALLKKHGIKVH